MHVGVIGPEGPDRFGDNIADALRRNGHAVTQLGRAQPRPSGRLAGRISLVAKQTMPRLDELAQRKVVRAAIAAECDVVINVDERLMPSAVADLTRYGVRVAFWFPDHVANLGRQMMLRAPYHAVFFKERLLVERLNANLDLPVYYLPQGCNPRWHRPIAEAGTEPYLVIAGNMYPTRIRLLERLIERGVPIKLYGNGFPRWLGDTKAREMHAGHAVFREDKARVFRSAAGVLNTMHPAEVTGVNSRLFEATACGAAVLTEFRPAVPELFSVGKEVLAFRDFKELVELAERLLSEKNLTANIGDAAAKRSHSDHSYDVRVEHILEKVV